MATEAQIAARIEALESAIASGVLTARHGDTSMTYRSMSEMLQALALLKSQSMTRGPRYIVQKSKGL
jgi:hypothetical protein